MGNERYAPMSNSFFERENPFICKKREKLKKGLKSEKGNSKVIKLKGLFAWRCYVRFILNVCMSEILNPDADAFADVRF